MNLPCVLSGATTPPIVYLFPALPEVPSTWVYLSSTIATTSEGQVKQALRTTQKESAVATTCWVKARITPRGITTSIVREGGQGNPDSLARGRARIQEQGFSGLWSVKSKSKVRRIAENWLYGAAANVTGNLWDRATVDTLAERRYVLLTLTLPAKQLHIDQEVRRKMLRPYLQDLKRKYQAANYMWFAEKQGNGNIHFHIILDRFVEKEVARTLWNKALARHDYVAEYRAAREAWHADGFRYDPTEARVEAQQRRAYDEGVRTGWSQPPTTDIRSVKGGAGGVLAYVVEYCAKGAQGEPGGVQHKLEGHLWGCNRELAKLERYEVEMMPELHQLIEAQAEVGGLRKVEGEHWKHFAGDIGRLLAYELPHLYSGFLAHWRAQAKKLPSRRSVRRAARQQKPLPATRVAGAPRTVGGGQRPGAASCPHQALATAPTPF